MCESEIERMFEAFYRGKDAPSGGAGLGLAIVEGFVRAHGGSIPAMNRDPCGAKFITMIPVETFHGELLEEPA